jgi:hypothetical protein
MMFSMPSPVLEIHEAAQYQRNVGTSRAATRRRRGSSAGAVGLLSMGFVTGASP